jgi:alkylhydroperoxidase/carboxymuconolactone decarboxylase family protein YurZ
MMLSTGGGGRLEATHAADRSGAHTIHEEVHMTALQEQLRRLALHDEDFIASVLAIDLKNVAASGLDQRTHALVNLAALIALGAAPVSYQSGVEAAFAAGATANEVVGTLSAVAPIVGVARTVSAVPKLALSIGYDIDAALDAFDGDPY